MLVLARMETLSGRFRRYRERVEMSDVLGMCCPELIVTVPEKAGGRRMERCRERCEGLLMALRGAELCFHESFPKSWEPRFRDRFTVANRGALIDALAEDIALKATRGRDAAFICAGTCSRDVLSAYRKLCRDFRHITVEAPSQVFDRLCREGERYGVSPAAAGRAREIRADAALFFADPLGTVSVGDDCAVVAGMGTVPGLHGGAVVSDVGFRFPEELAEPLPDGYPKDALFAAAVRAGTVAPDSIKVDWAK